MDSEIYSLPDLAYDPGALEPHISGRIMELHHDKHHAAYVKGANETLEKLAGASPADLPGLARSQSSAPGVSADTAGCGSAGFRSSWCNPPVPRSSSSHGSHTRR